jgi:hypothetical protein
MRDVGRAGDDDRHGWRIADKDDEVSRPLDDARGDRFQAGRIPPGHRAEHERTLPDGCAAAASASASCAASFDWKSLICRRRSLPSPCSRSIAAAGPRQHRQRAHAAGDAVAQRAEAGEGAAAAEKVTLEPPRKRSVADTAMIPIAPVRRTCVPPHAERVEVLDVDQPQRPPRLRLLAQPHRAALVGSGEADRDGTVFPHMRFASVSARAISCADTSRARSIVE